MDAGSWWGPAPAPATWGPAPTWAAPAPATWAAPVSESSADAGCRAAWISSVSPETFSPELCTLSGYWEAKFAEHGTISNSNQIDTSATGYQSLASVNAVFSHAGGYATLGRPGFIQDLGATSLVNPLGASGLS